MVGGEGESFLAYNAFIERTELFGRLGADDRASNDHQVIAGLRWGNVLDSRRLVAGIEGGNANDVFGGGELKASAEGDCCKGIAKWHAREALADRSGFGDASGL